MRSNIKKTTKQAQDEMHSKFPHITLLEEYETGHTKMLFRCEKCNHEWRTSFSGAINTKYGCPKCGVLEAKLKTSIEQFKEKLKNTDFEFIEYVGRTNGINIVSVRCKNCGYIRTTTMNNIMRYGCDKCFRKRRSKEQTKSTQQFIKQALQVHGDKYDYSKVEYVHNKVKVCITCPEHGDFWQQPIKHIYNQRGCPVCAGSSLEMIANTVLLENNVTFEKQKYINYKGKKMFIDFVLKQGEKEYFIELNGEQHYREVPHWERSLEAQQERDALLQEYCDNENIPLYWIRFDELVRDRIENIIKEITAVSTSDCGDNDSAKTVNPEMEIPC